MFKDGSALRAYREEIGLSQAKLAEVSGVPQHLLSAFELGKGDLSSNLSEMLRASFEDDALAKAVVQRKKRYREHEYSQIMHKPERVARHKTSSGNEAYLRELAELEQHTPPSFSALSLFSGCGGLSLGFRSAGCQIKGFVEIDDALSEIYSANFPGTPRIGGSIQDLTDDDLAKFVAGHGSIDVLVGGPPCQGFSLAGKRKVDDPRNELFRDYIRVVRRLRPKVAVLENVRLLTSMKNKAGAFVKEAIQDEFRKEGYDVSLFEINAKDFGVPQHRERVIFVAVDKALGRSPSLPQSSHGSSCDLLQMTEPYRTFADACSDLAFLESGESSADPLHEAVSHPDHVINWLWNVPEGRSAHDNEDPNMRPPSGYNTTYKRQIWNEPAGAVQTTFGMISGCRNVHPIATRSLTVREAARIQSFPDTYRFIGSLGTIRTGIGNAVPPLLARAIASHIRTRILNLVEVPRF
ncbi:MAG: DNA (cytosine-5-)-methyltransferase [Sphingomonadaceae bacterium]